MESLLSHPCGQRDTAAFHDLRRRAVSTGSKLPVLPPGCGGNLIFGTEPTSSPCAAWPPSRPLSPTAGTAQTTCLGCCRTRPSCTCGSVPRCRSEDCRLVAPATSSARLSPYGAWRRQSVPSRSVLTRRASEPCAGALLMLYRCEPRCLPRFLLRPPIPTAIPSSAACFRAALWRFLSRITSWARCRMRRSCAGSCSLSIFAMLGPSHICGLVPPAALHPFLLPVSLDHFSLPKNKKPTATFRSFRGPEQLGSCVFPEIRVLTECLYATELKSVKSFFQRRPVGRYRLNVFRSAHRFAALPCLPRRLQNSPMLMPARFACSVKAPGFFTAPCIHFSAIVHLAPPTLIPLIEVKTPNKFSNQRIRIMMTAAFRIDFTFESIGMYRFARYKRTPATIRVSITLSSGMDSPR